jgi:hypothetical protein
MQKGFGYIRLVWGHLRWTILYNAKDARILFDYLLKSVECSLSTSLLYVLVFLNLFSQPGPLLDLTLSQCCTFFATSATTYRRNFL